QTVSRFLPRLALYRAIDRLGLGDPLGLRDELPGLVNRSIQRIYTYQHGDGGWGWWREDPSQPYLTAYTLFGLIEARRAGFGVDQGVTDRAVRSLHDWLNGNPTPGARGPASAGPARPPAPGADSADPSVSAYVVYVLGEAGAAEDSRA